MLFHERIAQELDKIKPENIIEPSYQADPDKDHIVGDMSDGLKKMYTLFAQSLTEMKKLNEVTLSDLEQLKSSFPLRSKKKDQKAYMESAKKKIAEYEANMNQLKRRYSLLGKMFWLSVTDEFPELINKNAAVYRKFKVGWSEPEDAQNESNSKKLIMVTMIE